MTSRRFTFTLFEFEDPEDNTLSETFRVHNETRDAGNFEILYAKWQLEAAPTTGALHIQGWIAVNSPIRFSAIKKLLPTEGTRSTWNTAHMEICRGSIEDNEKYVSKVETQLAGPWSFGSLDKVGQGARSDLGSVRDAIIAGDGLRSVAMANGETFMRYASGITRFHELYNSGKVRDWTTEFVLYWGEAGSGKSIAAARDAELWARQLEGNEGKEKQELIFNWSPSNSGADWWDGYAGQPIVVIDDAYGALPWTKLLRLGDSAGLSLQVKGGTVQFMARRVYFTSNTYFDLWYKFAEHPNWDINALERRFAHIEFFTGNYKLGNVVRLVTKGGPVAVVEERTDEDAGPGPATVARRKRAFEL